MKIFQTIIQAVSPFLPWVLPFILIGGLVWVYFSTQENSGFRGAATYLGHLIIAILGWSLGRWVGLILISLPVLIYYYYMLFHLAMVVVPVSDPDDFQDLRQRFLIFVQYQWGVQYPHWMVIDTTGEKIERRIRGDQFGSSAPGLIWARSHQVVGLTTGMMFSRVPNSGTIFTGRYESPLAVVDLRTQLRTVWIEVVSSDGIPFRALLFTSFRVDNEKWDRDLYHKLLRQNPLLENAQKPDSVKGTYSFSRSRIQALFGTIGVSSHVDNHEEARVAKWDERALYQVEKTAREVLSQRRLNELWQPKKDRDGASAMDEIALEIKEGCSYALRQRGILVYSCRIVNLEFKEKEVPNHEGKGISDNFETSLTQGKSQENVENQIEQKQIVAWSADWEREAMQTRAEGKADADLLMQKAHAYAYTTLLTAFAEGMEEARLLDPQLPRYVIAIRFVGALEKLIGQQPNTQVINDARNELEHFKKMIPWTMDGG